MREFSYRRTVVALAYWLLPCGVAFPYKHHDPTAFGMVIGTAASFSRCIITTVATRVFFAGSKRMR